MLRGIAAGRDYDTKVVSRRLDPGWQDEVHPGPSLPGVTVTIPQPRHEGSNLQIAAVGRALPGHYYDQDTVLAALRRHWHGSSHQLDRVERLHRAVRVGGRHLALPIEAYDDLQTWGQANDAWIEVAVELGGQAVRDALDRAGLEAADVDALFFTTITGVATPSIDARLMNRMAFRRDVKRMPLFGLGCMAGAAGVARASDYVRAFPDQVAIVLAVELCSLTLQRGDLSMPALIASGLFGDGAAAVVIAGAGRGVRGPRVIDTRSVFYEDTERIMGWDVSEQGFKLVLSAGLPDLIRDHLRNDVDRFLADHRLTRGDVARWVCHPGGPKVLDAIRDALELPEVALARSWASLREVGNLSSASVLLVLRDTLDTDDPPPGSRGLMMALGPGFSSEFVLLEW